MSSEGLPDRPIGVPAGCKGNELDYFDNTQSAK